MNFADKLLSRTTKTKSFICAGFDPVITSFPKFILASAAGATTGNEDAIYKALTSYFEFAFSAIHNDVACVKPNIAFFEQYGLGGIRAYYYICRAAQELGLPVIADAKRGDIGNTAGAYSASFLGKNSPVAADALTVSPYLGFDTLEPYLKDCAEHGKGIFVLVKTSNPGSGDIQNLKSGEFSIAEHVASWVNHAGEKILGNSGYSSLGAVVGATYPEEAKKLRSLMPKSLFLIPGMGAQGGSAEDAIAGFAGDGSGRTGGIINISRGIFGVSVEGSEEQVREELRGKVGEFNGQISKALN